MRVLIACERSGIVREAFKAKGHDAWSCDLEPTDIPGNHYQGDVRDYLTWDWDLMIAHPPCTYLAKAGLHYLKNNEQRKVKLLEAFQFVKDLWQAPISKICIESPPGWLSANWKKPTQIIQPYYFGDNDLKETCLWLKGLPRVNGHIKVAINKEAFKPAPYWTADKKRPEENYVRKYYFSSKQKTGAKRSVTFPGIANAMANQWG